MSTQTSWSYADLWEAIADHQPDAVAQRCGQRSWTWAEMDRRADGIAAALLAGGLGHQAKVAQYLHNGPEYLESVYACFKASLVPVNTNYRYVDQELEYLWSNADVEAVVFHSDFTERCGRLRAARPSIRVWLWVAAGPDDECPDWAIPYERAAAAPAERCAAPWGRSGEDLMLLYTGGTTGMPKGVMWPQHQLLSMLDAQGTPTVTVHESAAAAAAAIDRPGPRVLPAAPLMHGTACWFAFSALQVGGSVVTMTDRSFSAPALLDTIVAHDVRGLCIVGDAFARPMVAALEAEPERWDLTGLRVVLSSGAMFSPDMKAALLDRATRAVVLDTLGSSESGTIGRAASSQGDDLSLGRFAISDRVKVIAEDGTEVQPGSGVSGRLAVGGHLPAGYYKDPVKTAEVFVEIDGRRYVMAGDWAEVEADGTIQLLGRGSGCINTGGEKVYPEEVEEALKRVPGIDDAAVVGVADGRFGQRVVGIVQPSPGAEVDQDQVIAAVRAELAPYKAPRELHVVEDLKRGPNGKLDYRYLGEVAGTASG